MKDNRRPLMIPPAADKELNAVEMARVWIAQRELHCVLNAGNWGGTSKFGERHAWGIVLPDVARHASFAFEDSMGNDARENLAMILQFFRAEIAQKTSGHVGGWPQGKP